MKDDAPIVALTIPMRVFLDRRASSSRWRRTPRPRSQCRRRVAREASSSPYLRRNHTTTGTATLKKRRNNR